MLPLEYDSVPAGSHACALLDNKAQRAKLWAGFIADGLLHGELVLLVGVSEQDTVRLSSLLAQVGVDAATFVATGQVVIMHEDDPVAGLPPNGDGFVDFLTGEIERSSDQGYPALRLSGIPPASGLAPHEVALGDVIRSRPLTALCPYLVAQLSARELSDVTALHDTAVHVGERARRRLAAAEPLEVTPPLLAVDHVTDLTELRHRIYLAVLATALPRITGADFLTAFNEVAMNALQHGRPPVSVRLWTTYGQVLCTVTDAGECFHDDHRHPAGTGLWVARRFCDRLTISSPPGGGCTVRLSTGR